ncbi:MAG: hypothetical protein M5U08_01340 [Burkholderiales bacterium]|nr:hypothetical protein [Burkholderiales bacterium]
MRFEVEKLGERLVIRIESAVGREKDILAAIQGCRRQSAWACPSGECTKVDAMAARCDGEAVLLDLSPHPGSDLSAAGIEECLRYMLDDALGAGPSRGGGTTR